MQLAEFLRDQEVTLVEMARMTGQPYPASVSKHARGVQFPSATLIEKYEEATRGMVRVKDWHELRLQQEAARRPAAGAESITPAEKERPAHA